MRAQMREERGSDERLVGDDFLRFNSHQKCGAGMRARLEFL